MSDYREMVARKLSSAPPTGIVGSHALPSAMFPHQAALTRWALNRGRAAIFADTGLGKMLMELAWADVVSKHTNEPIIIAAPLAVAQQIAREGSRFGIDVSVCREAADVNPHGINVTNYDRLHKFDLGMFGGVALDESSVIKHHDTRTFLTLTKAFRATPFKLCATATPAPNDWTELGTHAEFLGICTRQEMLSEYFTHDGGDTSVWRLKGHARDVFWRWVCTWGALIRKPSDLGFDDGAYNLPPLHLHEHTVSTEMPLNGMLFAMEAQGLSERRDARRSSMAERVAECALQIKAEWHKLAALQLSDDCHVEAGISTQPGAQGSGKPGTTREEDRIGDCQSGAQSGGPQGVHGGLLRETPGEVQAQHTGASGEAKRGAAGEVRAGFHVQIGAQGNGGCVAKGEPGKAPCEQAEEVRDNNGGLQGHDGLPGGTLQDLRHDRAGISDGGPLPQERQSSGVVVHAVQPRHREDAGQRIIASLGNRVPTQAWLIWCELNDEQDALEKEFGSLAFSVRGANSVDEKESCIEGWLAGKRPVMISKPSVMGWGLNFQHCHNMAFVGVTDSFEAFYQAVRRCWRFGQKHAVHAHIFASEAEGAVVANLKRKERDAIAMAESLSAETHDAVMQAVTGSVRHTNHHNPGKQVAIPSFLRS